MYDEFERAVTGRSREGLSFLGWLSIALGTLFAIGLVGAGLTAFYVHSRVTDAMDQISREVNEEVIREIHEGPAAAAEQMVAHLESHTRLLSATPQEGLVLLQDLGTGVPSEAFMDNFFGGTLTALSKGQDLTLDLDSPEDAGSLEINSQDGRVRLDLLKGDNGGALVIKSDDGEVRFDLRKTDDGGYLAIDSDDGQVRFDLVRDDDGGSLVIKSEEGEVRFDVTGGENGGRFVIQTPEETFAFGAGEEARSMPRWVPSMDGMPRDAKRVYSLDSPEGFLGAVAWEGTDSPGEVLSFFKDWAERENFEVRAENRVRDAGGEQSSLWARNEETGRVLWVVAEVDGKSDGTATEVLLGYGEGTD